MVITCSGISALFTVLWHSHTLRYFSDSLNHGSSQELIGKLYSQLPAKLLLLHCHIKSQAFLEANNTRSSGEIKRCNQ